MPTSPESAAGAPRLAVLLVALVLPIVAAAAASPCEPSPPRPATDLGHEVGARVFEPLHLPGALEQRFFIQEENDVFGLLRKSDRYYTQGLRVGARWAPRPANRIVCEPGSSEFWGFEFGQNIYTPRDISLTDLGQLRPDRPYAGYLHVGPTYELQRRVNPIPAWARLSAGPDETEASFSSNLYLELRLGRTGPKALGGPVQTGFHQLLRAMAGNDHQALPLGWGLYETANVGSLDLTAEYAADWVRMSRPVEWAGLTEATGSRLFLRVAPGARLDAGGMVDAAGLGLELRAGLAESDLPPAPESWGTVRPRIPFALYLWGRVMGRYVAYNRLIEGGLLHGVVSDVQADRWVGELTAGLVLRLHVIELVVANQLRSPEIKKGATQNFGSFQLSFLFY